MNDPGELIFGMFLIVLVGFIFFQAGRLINNWVKKRTSKKDEDMFNRMAEAFIQFRNDTNRRLENIEAVIAPEESAEQELKKADYKTLEIENETKKSITENKTANKERIQ